MVGGLAAGAVGIGGSVEIANIDGNTQAYIDQNSTVSAGGTVIVDAELVSDTSNGTAFAGTAGIVGVGAQVVDIQDCSTESATLNSGVTIPQAAAGVRSRPTSNRSLTAQALGGDFGGVAAGVGVAIANATGGPSAGIGSGAQIGQTGTVGGVERRGHLHRYAQGEVGRRRGRVRRRDRRLRRCRVQPNRRGIDRQQRPGKGYRHHFGLRQGERSDDRQRAGSRRRGAGAWGDP